MLFLKAWDDINYPLYTALRTLYYKKVWYIIKGRVDSAIAEFAMFYNLF